jgi:serine/threonine protein kinase
MYGVPFTAGTCNPTIPCQREVTRTMSAPGEATGDIPAGFRLLQPLGSGGSGQVYLAVQEPLGSARRPQALLPGSERQQHPRQFRRECDAARKLGPLPFVATVYEAGIGSRRPWIAVEYFAMGSLADLIRRDGRLAPETAVAIAVKLADGLAIVHEVGLLHGDVKPGNVLLTAAGDPVLVDFGLSAIRELGSSVAVDAFSPAYAAPETLKNGQYSESSEIWSLGCVLYEMLAGVPPFTPAVQEGMLAFIRRIAHEPVEVAPLDTAPEPVRHLVLRMLAKARDERPAFAGDVAFELRAAQRRSAGSKPQDPPAMGR